MKFDLYTASYSDIDPDGFVGIELDLFGEQEAGAPPAELHSPFGFLSRPLDPDVDADGNATLGCQALVADEGGTRHAWLGSDPRIIPLLPSLKKGEALFYGAKGQFVRMHEDGQISLFTTDDGTMNGNTIAMEVRPDGFRWICPWGKITFDKTGFHVLHSSGARLDLGAIGGLPSPLDTLSSYVSISAAMASVEGSVVSLGTDAGATEPAAKAMTVLSVLGSLMSAVQALKTAVEEIAAAAGSGGAPIAPAVAPAITAAETAASAAAAAIGAASVTMPAATSVT